MKTYYIYVWQTQYPEYTVKTGYDIEAADRYEAQNLAKERFAQIYGFDPQFIDTRVGWNQTLQDEQLEQYRNAGLPDQIPS